MKNKESIAIAMQNSGFENEQIMNEYSICRDNSNRIGQKHLDQTLTHIRERAPIPKGKLVSQLRIILLIGERYVIEYLDGLIALDIIKIEKGIVYWNYKSNEKEPLSNSEKEGKSDDNSKNFLQKEHKTGDFEP